MEDGCLCESVAVRGYCRRWGEASLGVTLLKSKPADWGSGTPADPLILLMSGNICSPAFLLVTWLSAKKMSANVSLLVLCEPRTSFPVRESFNDHKIQQLA